MEFLTLAYFTYNDGKPDKQSVYKYDNDDEAVARFHSIFGYITSADTKSIMCVILDKKGYTVRSEYWERKENATVTTE